MGPILAAVVVSEIDNIERFNSAQKLCGYAGLCPSTSSSGGKTFQGRLMPRCNKWLRWAFVEAAWVAAGCSPYFGIIIAASDLWARRPTPPSWRPARRMARIAWQLLTQGAGLRYPPPDQKSEAGHRGAYPRLPGKREKDCHKPKKPISIQRLSPAAPVPAWLVAKLLA